MTSRWRAWISGHLSTRRQENGHQITRRCRNLSWSFNSGSTQAVTSFHSRQGQLTFLAYWKERWTNPLFWGALPSCRIPTNSFDLSRSSRYPGIPTRSRIHVYETTISITVEVLGPEARCIRECNAKKLIPTLEKREGACTGNPLAVSVRRTQTRAKAHARSRISTYTSVLANGDTWWYSTSLRSKLRKSPPVKLANG